MIKRRSKLLRDALLVSTGSGSSVLLSGISSVIIARALGVTGRGVSSAVLAVGVLCGTLATGGVAGGLSYAFAHLPPDRREAVARAGVSLSTVLAAFGAALFILVQAVHASPQATEADIAATAVLAGGYVVQHVLLNLSLTASPLRWYAAAQFVPAVFVLVVTLALVLSAGLTVFSVIAVSAAGSLVGAISAFIGLRRNGAFGRPAAAIRMRLQAAVRLVRPYAVYSLLIFGTTSMTQIVQRLDIVLVANLRSAHAAGLYAIASQLGDLVLVIPAALAALVFRRGATAAGSHSRDAMRVLRWTVVLAVATTGAFAVLARVTIHLLVGSQYDGAVTPLRLLLPGLVVLSAQTVISGYVVSRGYARVALTAWTIAAVTGIVADVFVIPVRGADGAAVVSSASYLLVLVLHLRALRAARRSEQDGTRTVPVPS